MVNPKVDLFWASIADHSDRLDAWIAALPPTERRRAERFRIDDARRRFVLARTVLRRVLAARLECEASELELTEGEHGKPLLAALGTGAPQFNLSHSGGLVVLAIAETEIGIDIEQLRPIPNVEKLAHRFFSPTERERVFGFADSRRDHAFLRIWTQKEAYLKAIGIGVGMALRKVETEPDPARPPRVTDVAGDPDEAARWTLLEADIPGAVCTVAVEQQSPELRIFKWEG